MKNTLETIQGQTKKKTPKKENQNRRKIRVVIIQKKLVISGAAIRKLILQYK